jgi:hypothetical protein
MVTTTHQERQKRFRVIAYYRKPLSQILIYACAAPASIDKNYVPSLLNFIVARGRIRFEFEMVFERQIFGLFSNQIFESN